MTLREYRVKNKLTQAELAERIKPIYPRINVPLVSLIERGVVDAPEAIRAWVQVQSEAKTPDYTQTELNIIAELHLASASNPVSRARLKEITKECDRNNRRYIEALRKRGLWVIEGADHGYYMAKTYAEMVDWVEKYTEYARSIMDTRARMLYGGRNE